MLFTPLKLQGAFLIEPEVKSDERGFFARVFCEREFAQHGLNTRYVQCNVSHNARKGTLRGMHFQRPPHGEIKIVRCIRGSAFDVIIDLRPESKTRGLWEGVELSASNQRMLYVPDGFAQGFITLEDDTQLFYQMSEFYVPEAATGVRWNDAAFKITWPQEPTVITERDASYPDFLVNSGVPA
jgi:dTDP-4-dehydrorhamnose 3,5-epimerase